MSRNHNNGGLPNPYPYMSDYPSNVWNGIYLIFCFVVVAFLVLGGC